jgi:hypothetical protein
MIIMMWHISELLWLVVPVGKKARHRLGVQHLTLRRLCRLIW